MRERTANHEVGTKVNYRGMTMPAEILSGPHKSPGAARYLIMKADGNVSLVPEQDLTRIVPRLDKIAGTMAMTLYGMPYAALNQRDRLRVAHVSSRLLTIADETRGEA
jgi:hypothetical protein